MAFFEASMSCNLAAWAAESLEAWSKGEVSIKEKNVHVQKKVHV